MPDHSWLQFTDALLVGFADMDTQHRRLVALLNALAASVTAQSGPEVTARAFDEMIDYVHFHFHNEERMMQARGYGDFAMHTKVHGLLLGELAKLRSAFVEGREIEVLHALEGWLVHHISTSDRQLGAFLSGHEPVGLAHSH